MNCKKLLALADLVEKINPTKFSMTAIYRKYRKDHRCGAVGCVIGHAAAKGFFGTPTQHRIKSKSIMWCDLIGPVLRQLQLKRYELDYLFEARSDDNTPREAAARIRNFVKTRACES